MSKKIIFRADGNGHIGLGHVIRSLALAEMLKEDFECHFAIRNPVPALTRQILEVCKSIIKLAECDNDGQEAKCFAENHLAGGETVVLDGYHFGLEYQQAVKDKGCKLVCIDDLHAYHFVADVVVNHIGGVKRTEYSAELNTQFCLGLDYSLIRKPFREAARNRTYPTERSTGNLFVCLGGADPNNDTLEVLKQCEAIEDIERCYLVVGAAYPHKEKLDSFLSRTTLNVELLSDLSAEEMVHYMKLCGRAVTSASTISYEYLAVGGVLYLKSIADNQNDILRFLTQNEYASSIGEIHQGSSYDHISRLQKNPFDGRQRIRFRRLFRSLSLLVRNAQLSDLMLFYEWANDPATRAQSYDPHPIPLETHREWFFRKVFSDNCVMYVIEEESDPIGQIRFERTDEAAIISYSLDKNYRGQGLGMAILSNGVAQYRAQSGDKLPIIAFVIKTNIASIKAFRSLGFREQETIEQENSYKYVYTYSHEGI